eukprot:2426491-Rhodomonas_salina.3
MSGPDTAQPRCATRAAELPCFSSELLCQCALCCLCRRLFFVYVLANWTPSTWTSPEICASTKQQHFPLAASALTLTSENPACRHPEMKSKKTS